MRGFERGLRWAPTGVGPATIFGLRSIEKFEGIRVDVKEGYGTEDNMHRLCTYWFDENGLLIARYDPADVIDTARGLSDDTQGDGQPSSPKDSA